MGKSLNGGGYAPRLFLLRYDGSASCVEQAYAGITWRQVSGKVSISKSLRHGFLNGTVSRSLPDRGMGKLASPKFALTPIADMRATMWGCKARPVASIPPSTSELENAQFFTHRGALGRIIYNGQISYSLVANLVTSIRSGGRGLGPLSCICAPPPNTHPTPFAPYEIE